MKKYILTLSFMLSLVFAMAQSITLTFTAEDQYGNYHEFETVKIENLTRNWQHYLTYPNTSFELQVTYGIGEMDEPSDGLSVVGPNPFKGTAYAELQLTEDGPVEVKALQLDGKLVARYEGTLPTGNHRITFNAAASQMYLLVATTAQGCFATKLMNVGNGSGSNGIDVNMVSKAADKKYTKSREMGYFMPGDEMRYTAFNSDEVSNALTQQQYESEEIVLLFIVTPPVELPQVVTNDVTDIASTSAVGNGEVVSEGGADVTERGICWSTEQNPGIDGAHASNGMGEGCFNVNMTGLLPNTTYYVRAYATNSAGTAYGEQKTFATLAAPTGALSARYSVSATNQILFSKGNLQYQASTDTWRFAENQWEYFGSSNANISISYSGWIDLFGWGTGHNPTNSSVTIGDYNGFTDWGYKPISNGGNSANQWRTLTRYEWNYLMFSRATTSGIRYAKAMVNGVPGVITLPDDWNAGLYALNSTNTIDANFATNAISLSEWNGIFEANGAVFLPAAGHREGSSVSDVGTYGYYWSSLPDGSDDASGLYFHNGMLYMNNYARYYGQSVRLVAGAETSFPNMPQVITGNATSVGVVSAVCGGDVVEDGNASVTARGVCWSTNENPTIDDSHTTDGIGTGSFTSNLTSLTDGTTYYVRAYATNSTGTAYGEQKTFTTGPIVTTNSVSNINTTTATCGGSVVDNVEANITAKGVCWNTSENPTINDSHTNDGTGTSPFTSNMTGLTPNTTYYVRAYATNNRGTSYGEQKTFSTLPPSELTMKLFSVSSTRQVNFSKGNLQYQASTRTWRFAESQLECIGSNNANISSSYSDWIDLFGWGTGNNPTNASTGMGSYSSFTDWGSNPISNGGNQADQWRTLTKDEWSYLMFTRTTTSGIRYAKASVNETTGVIILPDDWDTNCYNLNSTNTSDADYTTNSITLDEWTSKFEANGAVFLPAAGYRYGTSINYVGTFGRYWSSSPDTSVAAYFLSFDGSYNLFMGNYYNYNGQSVRLVADCE